MCKCHALAFLPLFSAAVAAGLPGDMSPGFGGTSIPFPDVPAAFTLAAEFRTLETPELIAIPGYIANAGTATTNGFSVRVQSATGGKYDLQFSLAKTGGAAWVAGSGGSVAPGRWCRVVARWDGSRMTLDADGKRIGEAPCEGPFVPAADGLLSINRAAIGYTYYPLEMPVAAYVPRAWSDEETAAFFAAKREDDPCALGVAAALDKWRSGDMGDVAAACEAPPIALHPMTLAKWRERQAFALLKAGDVSAACRVAAERMAASPDLSEPDGRLDFAPAFSGALAASGERALAVQVLEDLRRSAICRGDLSAAPLLGLARADALEASGRSYAALCEREEAMSVARGTRLADVVVAGGTRRDVPGKEAAAESSRVVFFVSPDGDDANPGTFERPFKTLLRARDAVRLSSVRAGTTVYLRGGRYQVSDSLVFGPEDSGRPWAPVAWRAWKDERPVVSGASPVGPLVPVTDPSALARIQPAARPFVREADLSSVKGYGFRRMPAFGFGTKRRAATVVVEDGEAMKLAIHPNSGFLRVAADSAQVRGLMTDQGFQQRGEAKKPKNGFFADDPSLRRFAGAKDLMVRGYWTYYWADLASRVESIDPASGAVVMSVADADEEPRVKTVDRAEPGNPFWFLNALEAVDEPGEWYIDNEARKLYVWPSRGGRVSVSVATNDLVVADGLSDFSFEGIAFDGGSASALSLSGCTNVAVRTCSFKGFGISAAKVDYGRCVSIEDSAFADVGHTALVVSGGDRRALEPCFHKVRRCTFARNSMYGRVHPTILVNGVGVEISECDVRDTPSSVIRLEGNDHLVVSNRIARAVQECDDNAAIDIYRNPSYAGCKFLFNVFEDCGKEGGFADCGQAAIRFDGNISGMTVHGNTFRRCGTAYFGAINVNGGRLNVIDSNVFEDCAKGVTVFFYPDWHWRYIWRGGNHHAVFIRRECFENLGIREGVYAERYPGMAQLPELPQVNFVTRNRGVGCPVYDRLPPATALYGNSIEAVR